MTFLRLVQSINQFILVVLRLCQRRLNLTWMHWYVFSSNFELDLKCFTITASLSFTVEHDNYTAESENGLSRIALLSSLITRQWRGDEARLHSSVYHTSLVTHQWWPLHSSLAWWRGYSSLVSLSHVARHSSLHHSSVTNSSLIIRHSSLVSDEVTRPRPLQNL